jgi:hypothetical protein
MLWAPSEKTSSTSPPFVAAARTVPALAALKMLRGRQGARAGRTTRLDPKATLRRHHYMPRAFRYNRPDIQPTDPLTFAGIAALLGTVVVIASWLPARRAARVDPTVALRQ